MKIIQLNMERDCHLHRIVPFFVREQADIICLQEVFEEDLYRLAEQFAMEPHFAPMTRVERHEQETVLLTQGVGILTRAQARAVNVAWYFGAGEEVPIAVDEDRTTSLQPLLSVAIESDGRSYTIATTHFMKSWRGVPDEFQRERMRALVPAIRSVQPDVLTGDFNIPRGTELYFTLAQILSDAIPVEYASSIDPELHRVPGLEFMIDYVWTSPRARVTAVRQVCGVSDHCAFVGTVEFVG